ncbi:MAG: cache and HAMP domain-containing protein, partial [Anaerolineae bacterium]|nr:cache and HAMP domain-containing protein [Anaerolineae bacterium]
MPVKKTKTSRSLLATLAVAFVVLSLAASLITYLPQFVFFVQARQESTNSQQQLIAYKAASTVASFVQEKFRELETAAKIEEPASGSWEGQQVILEKLLGLDRAFRQLLLLNAQNQEEAGASRISQAAVELLGERLESELFTQVKQGGRYISPVYVDDATSEPMVLMAVPVTNVFGDFQGTLLAEVNLKFMWDLVNGLKVGQTGLAYVVDKQGNLIAFGDNTRVLRGENVSHLTMIDAFIRNSVPVDETATSVVQGINGDTVVGTYVPLGVPDWAVVTELPTAEAYQPSIKSAAISGGVMLIVLVLVGLGGLYIARRLAVPLLNLTATATQIAEGELELEAPVEGPTEVIRLAGAFN